MVVVTMAMMMPVMGRLLTLIQLVLQQITDDGTTKSTQQPMVLLVSEVISRRAACKRTSDSTLALGVDVGIMLLYLLSAIGWLRARGFCYMY